MSCKSRTALTVCRDRCEASWAGYHRCHGEACVSTGTRVELSVGSLCMDNKPLVRRRMMQREPDFLASTSLARPVHTAASPACPDEPAISTARDKAEHLPHQGFSSRTREPQVERWPGNSQQAAKPGAVSTEGQSLRSSRRTGKPCTGRRETVGEYGGAAAGVSDVYRN
jgi:hypothetical protein